MKTFFTLSLLIVGLYSVQAQTLQRVKYTPLGIVKDMAYNERYGLFVAGQFEGWGINAGSVAMFTNGSDVPDTDFPRFYGTVTDMVSDDNGGWYVAGNNLGLINENDSINYPNNAIVHILPDYRIDFSFAPNIGIYSQITINKLVKKGNVLYAVGDFYVGVIGGNALLTNIIAVNAVTGVELYFPKIKGIVRSAEYNGVLYAISNGSEDLRDSADVSYGKRTISINLQTKRIRDWTPTFPDTQILWSNSIACNNGKVLIGYAKTDASNNPTRAGVAAFDTTNLATVPVSWSYHVPYAHSLTIAPFGIFFHNQAVYIPVWTADNNYVFHALNTATGTPVDDWNVNQFTFQHLGGAQYSAAPVEAVVIGDKVYIYGGFIKVNNVDRNNWAAIDLSTKQVLDWDIQAATLVTNANPLYAYQDKLFTMARPGDSYYKYVQRPHLALLNPITQELIPKRFSFLPTQPTNFWHVSKVATTDNIFWVAQSGQNPTEVLAAYDIPTEAKLNTGNFVFRYQSGQVQDINKLVPVGTELYVLGRYTSVNDQTRPGLAAISVAGNVLPFTFTTNGEITDFSVIGDLVYIAGTFTQINGITRNYLASVNRFTGELTDWNPNPERPVSALSVVGNNVFFSRVDAQNGQYRSYLVDRLTGSIVHVLNRLGPVTNSIAKEQYVFFDAETLCSGLNYFDTERKSYAAKCPGNVSYRAWPMVFAGSRLYFYPQAASFRQRLMQVTFPPEFFKEEVEYFPKIAGNAGISTIYFYGYNFSYGTRIILSKSGETDFEIPLEQIGYPSENTLRAKISKVGISPGRWNIKIIFPNGIIKEIEEGLEIVPVSPPVITADIIASPALRLNTKNTDIIRVFNKSQTDSYLTPVWLIVPQNCSVKFPFAIEKIVNDKFVIDTLSYYDIDSVSNMPYKGRIYSFLIGHLEAMEIRDIKLEITPFINPRFSQPFRLKVIPNYPLYSPATALINTTANNKAFSFGDFKNWFNSDGVQCALDLLGIVLPIEDDIQCGLGLMKNIFGPIAYKVIGFDLDEISKIRNPRVEDPGYDWARGIFSTITDCVEGIPGAKIFKYIGNGFELKRLYDKCTGPPPLPIPVGEKSIDPFLVNSRDPNDKLGPAGVGSERYITGQDPNSYQIRFENQATATAAAQYVEVTDQLDPTKFDFSSFQFGFFNVADEYYYSPPGRKTFLQDVDLRPAKNLILRMEGNFNETTGALKATYTALDPATMELTADPILGFLPPNATAPEGEGSIFFSISPKADLSHGTSIANGASIVFDANEPIITPIWNNTLDKVAPVSSVNSLPAATCSTTLSLSWTGSDEGSGVRLYDVYVSVNDEPYQAFISNTTSTTALYIGEFGKTYKFYSVAVDGVGNQEETPATFDTQTTIQTLAVSLSSTAALACSGASVTLTATPSLSSANPYTYQFTGQASGGTSNTFVASTSGDYSVTVTDGGSCSAISDPLSITINPTLVVSLSSTPALACSGNSVTLTATTNTSSTEGFLYQFTGQVSPGTAHTFVAATTGDYSVTVTNGASCSAVSDSPLSVTLNPPLQVSLVANATTACAGGSVTLTAILSASTASTAYYQFTGQASSSTANTFVASASGTYAVTVTAGQACSAVVTSSPITINPAMVVSLSSTTAVACSGESLTLTATAGGGSGSGYRYQFTGQATPGVANTITASTSGGYSVTVTDGVGCQATPASPLQVTISSLPTATFNKLPDHYCVGAVPLILSPITPGGVFTLNGVGTLSGNVYTPPASGTGGAINITYSVTVNGCSNTSTQSSSVIFQLPPIINLIPSGTLGSPVCSIRLTATATGSSFVFTGPMGYVFSNAYRASGTYEVFALEVKQPGIYTLTAYELGGCQTSKQVQVNGSACPP